MWTLPSLEASGQFSPALEPSCSALYWASEQVAIPSARDGLTVRPSGRGTTAFLGSVSEMPLGLVRPTLGSFSSKSNPDGFSASLVVGWEEISGLKGTAPQPIIGAG